MNSRFSFTALFLLLSYGFVFSQETNTMDEVHLFQSFFRDAPISNALYGEGGLQYNDFDFASQYSFFVQGGYPIMPNIEVGAAWGFSGFNPDNGDGESGLNDLFLTGRYNIVPGPTKISSGGYLTLPIGEEKIGNGDLDFGVYGALRHPLEKVVLTGTIGIDFIEMTTTTYNPQTFEVEEETEYETSIYIGAGTIIIINPQVNIVPELVIQSEGEYTALSGAVDYTLNTGGRLRGGLLLGLDDGAPDIGIILGFLKNF